MTTSIGDRVNKHRLSVPTLRWSPILLLVAVMIADLFFGDLDIGPASSRIYLMAIALAIAVHRVIRGQVRPAVSRLAVGITLTYLLFIVWAMFNTLFRGGGLRETIEGLGSTVVFGWFLLITVQLLVRRPRDAQLLGISLGLTAATTAGVAMLQWFGFSPAWDVARLLRPDATFDFFNLVRGLNLFSISLGYHLLVGLPFLIGMALWWQWQSRLLPLLIAVSIGVVAMALIFSLSRSAIGAGVIVLILMFSLQMWRPPGGKPRSAVPTIYVLTIVLSSILATQWLQEHFVEDKMTDNTITKPSSDDPPALAHARYSLSRNTSTNNSSRLALWRYAIDSWFDSPVIGDAPRYRAGYPARKKIDPNLPGLSSPHNLVLNSLVLYGVIGTALMLTFLGLAGWLALSTVWRVYSHPVLGPLAVVSAVGLITFLINAQFHNESFVSGSTLGFWTVAILAAVDRISRSRENDVSPNCDHIGR